MNNTLFNLEQKTQFLFLGTNLRMEAPLLNARLRKSYLNNFDFKAYSIGLSLNHLTFPVLNFGNSVLSLVHLLEGKNIFLRNFYFKDYFNLGFFNKNSLDLNIFLGNSFLTRADSSGLVDGLIFFFKRLQLSFSNLHFISSYLGKLTFFELGLGSIVNSVSTISNNISNFTSSFIYFCGVDLENLNLCLINENTFVVFQGSFFSQKLLDVVNLILPSTVYTEEASSYII